MAETKRVNYLNKAGAAADRVYNKILSLRCKHRRGAQTFEQMIQQRAVTDATSASIAYQEAGLLHPGKIINHSNPVGGPSARIVKEKDTIEKSVDGIENLITDHVTVMYIGKYYSSLPRKYKQKGCMYVQDNNVCISAGGGSVYSCNNALGSQLDSKGRYKRNKITSGYAFNSPILVAILPNK